MGLVYPLTYTNVGLLGPFVKLVEWITYLHAAKRRLCPKKTDAKRASTGIGPSLTEPARTPGVPFHGGMVLPILDLTAPVAGHSYLIWGKYALGSL